MAQGIETIFGFSALFGSVVAVASGYFFIVRWDMGPIGWVYSKTVYEVINLFASLYAYCKTHPRTRGVAKWSVVKVGFIKFFCMSVKFAVGSYSEFLASEIASYFVFLTHDDLQIAAFSAILNLGTVFYSMGETFAIICRTRMNLLIGKQHHRIAKNFYLFYFLTLAGFGLLIGSGFFIFRDYVTDWFANSTPEISAKFKKLLTIYSLCIASELTITSSFMGIKTIGSIGFLLMLNILLFVGANFGLNYYFTQELGYQTEAILITVQALFYLENILCLIKVMMTDWTGLKVEDEFEQKRDPLVLAESGDQDLRPTS
jgi:hypothetical protein